MSWDISIQDLPAGVTSVADIPDDFVPQPLGPRADLIARIAKFSPATDFSDVSWGELVTPEFVIEFNMGRAEIVDGMMLHVRGGGEAAAFVDKLLEHLDMRAIDYSEGEFFDLDSATQSFGQWQDFRDRVTGPPEDRPAPTQPKRRWFRR